MMDCTKNNSIVATIICCFTILVFIYIKYNNIDINDNIWMNEKKLSNDFKNVMRKKYENILCDMDKPSVRKLKDFNLHLEMYSNAENNDFNVYDFLHQFVQNPHHSFCNELKRFGGQFNLGCKFTDGSKFVCMDDLFLDILNGECLIYSFGIADDWSFEDVMDNLGCKVYALDGSVEFPEQRGNSIHFEKVWVSYETVENKNRKSFESLLRDNGHESTRISYLKMDIEGNELKCLPAWLKSGILDNIQQIGFEFHLDNKDNNYKNDKATTINFIDILKKLYFHGNSCTFVSIIS